VLLTLVIVGMACPRAGTDPQATTATAAPSPPHWMSVSDGKLHQGLDDAPIGLYVGGELEGGMFKPGGDVEGQGPVAQPGAPAYLQLSTGSIVVEKPMPPYLEGTRATDGTFSPKSRKIIY
jgi:hypothetical protein